MKRRYLGMCLGFPGAYGPLDVGDVIDRPTVPAGTPIPGDVLIIDFLPLITAGYS